MVVRVYPASPSNNYLEARRYTSDKFEETRIYGLVWVNVELLPGDDWLPFIEPSFPPLPPKPGLVYARTDHNGDRWWMHDGAGMFLSYDSEHLRRYGANTNGYTAQAHYLTVIPHRDNDPEPARLIEEAKTK
jgi:hypothetical protein